MASESTPASIPSTLPTSPAGATTETPSQTTATHASGSLYGETGYPPYPVYPPPVSYSPSPDAGYVPYPYPYPSAMAGYYPWMYAPPAPRLSTWALVSMICGIVSMVSLQPIIAGLAIVFSLIGMNEVKKSAGTTDGRGFAIAGLVTGIIAIVIWLLIIALYILFYVAMFSTFSTMPD
ncbi:MAG TPA: DUF4190 domain-containing protein [Ktedonobacterales bacterium]